MTVCKQAHETHEEPHGHHRWWSHLPPWLMWNQGRPMAIWKKNLWYMTKKTFVSHVTASKQPHEKHEEPQVAQENLSKPLSNDLEIAPFDPDIQGLRFWQQQTQQPSLHAE